MKKTLIAFSAAFALCAFVSCGNKSQNEVTTDTVVEGDILEMPAGNQDSGVIAEGEGEAIEVSQTEAK